MIAHFISKFSPSDLGLDKDLQNVKSVFTYCTSVITFVQLAYRLFLFQLFFSFLVMPRTEKSRGGQGKTNRRADESEKGETEYVLRGLGIRMLLV